MSKYQRKHSLTHTCCGHQSSLICFFHLLRSMASSLYNLLAWQSSCTISVQVFFGLLLGLALSTHSQYISSPNHSLFFRSTCSYRCDLFCCSTEIMSSNPSLSLNSLLGALSCSLMPHIHLIILISALIFLSDGPGLTYMQHTASRASAVQSPSHYQWYILIGKQWYQLPEFIHSNSISALHSCISISVYTQHVT